ILDGGGACWGPVDVGGGFIINTCDPANGFIDHAKFGLNDSKNGQSWAQVYGKNPMLGGVNSPFKSGFNIVRIPYCTGDVHAGNVQQSYGSHSGYSNVTSMLKAIYNRFPAPNTLVFEGGSAGGLGVECNLQQVRTKWPSVTLYSINDSGIPLMPPCAPLVPYV